MAERNICLCLYHHPLLLNMYRTFWTKIAAEEKHSSGPVFNNGKVLPSLLKKVLRIFVSNALNVGPDSSIDLQSKP